MSVNESIIKNAVLTGSGNLAVPCRVSRDIGGIPHSHRSKVAAKPACASHLVIAADMYHFWLEFLFKRKPELGAPKTKGPDNYRSPTPTESPQSLPAIVKKANRPQYP